MAATREHPQVPVSTEQSTSDLSDPPESADEPAAEIVVRFTRQSTPQNRPSTNTDTLTGDDQTAENNKTEENSGNQDMAPAIEAMAINQPAPRPKRPRRPSRRAAAASESDDELSAEVKVAPSTGKRRVPAKRTQLDNPTKPPAVKKIRLIHRRPSKWDPDNVTQSSRSPLVDVDLRTLLLQPAAWDCLTPEDKQEVLALFPDETHILDPGTPEARPNIESLRNDNSFRHDAEEYTTNLSKGMHDPSWLKDAWAAHHRRAAGDFDEFYIRKLEVDWNTTIPDEFKPEHLRSARKGGESFSTPHSHSNQGADRNGPVKAGSPSEKNSTAEKEDASPAGDNNGEATESKTSNGICEVADSIKARVGGGGLRCEVIPEEDMVHGEVTAVDFTDESMKVDGPEIQVHSN